MKKQYLAAAIAVALMGAGFNSVAAAEKAVSAHKFKGSVEGQYRTNTNISAAPSSSNSFDYAKLSEFGDDEDGELDGDDDDDFDDVLDVDPDEDEIEFDDAIDEDGDGIDDLIDPDADITVDEESRFTTKIGLGDKYTFANGSTSWNNGVKFVFDRHKDRGDLNKFNWAVTTGLAFAPKTSKHSFKPSLSYVSLEKDSNKFVSTFVISLGYDYEVSKTVSLGATYNYQDKDVTNPEAPDARVDTVALSADIKASKNDIFKFKYAPKVEDSTMVTRNTDASGWEVTYTRKLLWEMAAGIGYKYDTVEFKNLAPPRKDKNDTYGVQLAKDFSKSFGMELGYEKRKRDSNIPNKDATNRSVYLTGTFKF